MKAGADILVVGAGQAAAQLAISLRQGGFDGRILVVGEEPYLPYQRPPLSKKFLVDPRSPDALLLRPAGFWKDQDVEFHLNAVVATVDLGRNRAVLGDGREFPFRTLVFATGTSARRIDLPGIRTEGVFSLRMIDDVRRLRSALDTVRHVIIAGGGYIGLEVAASMATEGRQVTVLEAEDRVLKRVTGKTVSAFFDAMHRAHGVDIRLRTKLAAVEGLDRVRAVVTGDGERLAADLVLIAAGARPNDALAIAAGLHCQDGIMVDDSAQTQVPGIYAVGDCARLPSRRYAQRIRLECVQNAIDQAKAAVASILGSPQCYDPVPWFWSDQYNLKLQIAGLTAGTDADDVVGDPGAARFSVEYRRAGRLVAVDAVNDARAHMMARRRIAEETATPND